MGDAFWKTPEGKILSYGIHEHNSGLGYINNSLSIINTLIEQGGIKIQFNDEESEKWFNNSLKRIKEGKVKCRKSMDYVYEEIKKLKESE
tara:strand:- start:30292 stop:30561 length:270 start_codon:yes stop_codon:yes gene_type:complete